MDRSLAGRLDPGLPGARALAVVGVLAAVAAGGYLWMSRPVAQPAPASVRASMQTSGQASGRIPGGGSGGTAGQSPIAVPASAGPAAGAAPAPSAGTVVVHVAGKVRRPGIVTLAAGARVHEAIEAAGGLRAGAGTDSLNLARRVVDGERIAVGIPAAAEAAPGVPPADAAGPGGAPGPAGVALDLNTATSEQFQRLPGVGPVLAQRIVDYRTDHGGFRSVEQLREVSGIGERRFAELRPRVRV